MEHLYGAGTSPPLLEAPYISVDKYDNAGFFDFPQRKGYKDNWQFVTVNSKTTDDAPFLQTWLYFGLLSEVLGVPIDQKPFTREITSSDGSTRCIITTALLEEYAQEWGKRDTDLPEPEKHKRLTHVENCLHTAWKALECAKNFRHRLLTPEVEISIDTLGVTLSQYRIWVYGLDKSSAPIRPFAFGMHPYMAERMREDKWCPADLDALASTITTPAMYYVHKRIKPRLPGQHGSCSDKECLSNQIDSGTYESAHRQPGCSCAFLGDVMTDVVNINQGGGIPVIEMSANGPLEFSVVEAYPGLPYIAISHVWSEGLGNSRDNSMPRCQLLRLRKLIEAAYARSDVMTIYFWIDTLCVPISPSRIRKLAVSRMKDVYRGAYKVLVLDKYIQDQSISATTQDCLITIACSSWMRRLWTLQEGMLARTLVFQLSDGLFEFLAELVKLLRSGPWVTSKICPLTSAVSALTQGLLPHSAEADANNEDNLADQSQRLAYVWKGMKWRTTSDKSDETICIATLLGLNTLALSNTPPADRNLVLFRSLPCFPAEAIFWSGERLKGEGLGWAPNSFLDQTGIKTLYNSRSQVGVVTPHGLEVRYAGWFVYTEKTPLHDWVYIGDVHNTENWYKLTLKRRVTTQPWTSFHRPRKVYGVILQHQEILDSGNPCLVVEILRREMDPIPCKFECTAFISPLDEMEKMAALAFAGKEQEPGVEHNFSLLGNRLGAGTKWLVG